MSRLARRLRSGACVCGPDVDHDQIGAAAAAFTDASGPPAWKTLPSWAVVATGDKAAGTDVIRPQAQRAGADIVEVEGSHVSRISQPQAVTHHILQAAGAVPGPHP